MLLAPVARPETSPAPALRRLIGVPVLAMAGLVVVPWMIALAIVAGAVLLGRLGVQALDLAGAAVLAG